MTTIGFVGLGHMGHPMAERLLQADHRLYIYDVIPGAMHDLIAAGALAADSLAMLAEKSDIIFTSVQTGQQVKAICLGETGLFAHARQGALYIDCSSIDVKTTQHLHAEAAKHHLAMLDAPVSGGVAGAKAGSLTFMIGGRSEDFERALPILNSMGQKIIHAGAAGSGQAAKICNNLLLGISMIGVCEAFSLAEKLGLQPKKFFEISAHATGQCWSMTSYCPVPNIIDNVPANNQYQPGFMAKMMLKDLRLGEQAAQDAHASIALGKLATDLYEQFVAAGNGNTDFSGIMQMIAKS